MKQDIKDCSSHSQYIIS